MQSKKISNDQELIQSDPTTCYVSFSSVGVSVSNLCRFNEMGCNKYENGNFQIVVSLFNAH